MEFLSHLFPLLAVSQEVISATVEAFPPELLSLLVLLPLVTLALSLLLQLVLDDLDNFFHFISLYYKWRPLFVLLFLEPSGTLLSPPALARPQLHGIPPDVGPLPSPPPSLPARRHPNVLASGAPTQTGMHEMPPLASFLASNTAIPEIFGCTS